MHYYTVRFINTEGVEAVGEFDTLTAAWRFLAVCDETGTAAGYPEKVKVER